MLTSSTLLLLCFSVCVALHHDRFSLHSQQANASDIEAVEFEQQFTQIKSQVDYISRTLNLNDSSKFAFIIQKCKEISSGFNALHRSLLKFKLLISPQTLTCPRLSQFNRTEIRRYLAYTEGKEKEVSLYYTTCGDCAFIVSDIDKMLDLTHSYFQLINQTLDGDYCARTRTPDQQPTGLVDLNRSFFKNNLAAGGWYYGSTTKSDYKVRLFKRAATYNLTNCPPATPFVRDDQQLCFGCPAGSLYNLGTEACTVCQLNEIFNIETGACEECLGSKEVVNNTVSCRVCNLANAEVYNQATGKCEVCNNTRYLDRSDNLCKDISCPADTPRFNSETQLCQSCGSSEIINPKDPTRCIRTNYVGMCPSATPLYDNQSHTCKPCPSGSLYSKSANLCVGQDNTSKPS